MRRLKNGSCVNNFSLLKDILDMNEDLIVEQIVNFMKDRNLNDLNGSARSPIWIELSKRVYKNQSSYSKQQQLHTMWHKPNGLLKIKVLFSLDLTNERVITVKFTPEEWAHMLSTATNASKCKFLVKFDDFLSKKLQDHGLKCWLRSNGNNRLKKTVLWEGKYTCMENKCEIFDYRCFAEKNMGSDVSVHVTYRNNFVSHEKLVNKLRVTGSERYNQKFSLTANGILNTQAFNSNYNKEINDPSNFILILYFLTNHEIFIVY
jgi:hypothetical protein